MESNVIKVHPLSSDPTAAWREISKSQNFTQVPVKNPTTPTGSNKIRIVCMSDTHSNTDSLPFSIPNGDIFVHAGDFTMVGEDSEIQKFNQWISTLPHKYKVVIVGNHELSFDKDCEIFSTFYTGLGKKVDDPKDYLRDCIYLHDSAVTLYGLKFYGAPWQPEHGGWAFNLPRGEELLAKWDLIPEDTDVLITHGPPLGHGDALRSGERVGCVELLSTIQKRVKPICDIFGHIHEAYGMSTDGTTVYINASTCNSNYVPKNLPIVVDVALPESQKKD